MLDPQTGAIMQGLSNGEQQAKSIIPNASQPLGRGQFVNYYEGELKRCMSSLLGVAAGISMRGGDALRGQTQKLYKMVYEIDKLNDDLNDIAKGQDTNG